MIDFHCHLDLYKDSISLLPEVRQRCKFILAVTTSPRAWIKTSQVFSGVDCISVALGLHPEILTDKIQERELFLSSIPKTIFIGEIGLDGTSRNKGSLSLQIEFFKEAMKTAERCGGRIISIHSRNAVKATLDIIETTLDTCTPVMHWFSGTEKELERAISMNCWFSINPMMFASKRGLSIIQKIPLSKMLPETDGPFTMNGSLPYMPWDTNTVIEGIVKQKDLSAIAVYQSMIDNLHTLGIKAD